MKKAIVSVINDLSTDQRVRKHSLTLIKLGYDVTLVGRQKRDSRELERRDYNTKRLKLIFEKGPLFYAEYNIRLFFFLLFRKADLLVANDLDTLLPNFICSKIKGVDLVYDTHEYFTGVPELENRKTVKNIWKLIEKNIFPKLKTVITVNDSIAGLYQEEYGNKIHVVRNIPPLLKITDLKSRKSLGLPQDKKIVLLQGAGINIHRGAEEAVEAMQFLDNVVLLIIGGGDIINTLKNKAEKLELSDKVIIKPKMSYNDLMQYTSNADLGLTLDKDTNINYRYSLPNKLFDYIQAGIPVLASPLTEIKKIIEQYNIGELIRDHQAENIALSIKSMLSDEKKTEIRKENLKIAAIELCWENEEKHLINVYNEISG